MAATVATLKARCAEFASTATATIELALADALAQLDMDAWSTTQADLAHIYLSAHILKLWKAWAVTGNAPAGPLQSVRDGDLAKTYVGPGQMSVSDAELASTAYGREFMRIRSMGFASRVMGSTT